MEGFRLTVTGSSEEMDVLELFCRQYGVLTERGVVSAYEGGGGNYVRRVYHRPVQRSLPMHLCLPRHSKSAP